MKYLYIGLGGAVGSILRFVFSKLFQDYFKVSFFPIGTLLVNIIGAFLIGIIFEIYDQNFVISPEIKLLLATGFCGGFTTFSTFSNETMIMFSEGDFFYASIYIVTSVFFSLLAVYLGRIFIKLIATTI